MKMNLPVFLICIVTFLSSSQDANALTSIMDEGLKYVESIYSKLEENIDGAYKLLKKKTYGLVLTNLETIDRKVAEAIEKVKGLAKMCHEPAADNLDNMRDKIRNDYYKCTMNISERLDAIYGESQSLLKRIHESYNTSVTELKNCVSREYRAISELDVAQAGSCVKTTATIADRFVADSSLVNDFLKEILKMSYEAAIEIGGCLKMDVIESSLRSIVSYAHSCANNYKESARMF